MPDAGSRLNRHERPASHRARPGACRRGRCAGGRRAAPARDSLQLHLVLRPRDRASACSGARAWELLNQLREERRTGRSARMLYEVLGDIWVVQRNPYLQDDLLDNPKRRAPAGRCPAASAERGGTPPHARTPTRSAMRWWANCCGWPRARGAGASTRISDEVGRPAPAARSRVLGRLTAKDNIKFDGLSRVSHVTDATDWRVEYPFVVLTPDSEAEMAGAGEGLHRAGPDHHPARRRHRLHRRRGAADLEERGHQHREARGHERGGDGCACPAWTTTVPTIWTEAGVVTQRVADAAERAGYVFAVDPTSAEASLHRRQHRHERGRQEGRAVGHGAGQPGLAGAWSRPRPSGWR